MLLLNIHKGIDSQPLVRAFSFSIERDKALYGLKGILIGLVADQRLNEMELLFLDSWLQSQKFLSEEPLIQQRVPQYMIASYLGMTPETLSRIRKKLTKRKAA